MYRVPSWVTCSSLARHTLYRIGTSSQQETKKNNNYWSQTLPSGLEPVLHQYQTGQSPPTPTHVSFFSWPSLLPSFFPSSFLLFSNWSILTQYGVHLPPSILSAHSHRPLPSFLRRYPSFGGPPFFLHNSHSWSLFTDCNLHWSCAIVLSPEAILVKPQKTPSYTFPHSTRLWRWAEII